MGRLRRLVLPLLAVRPKVLPPTNLIPPYRTIRNTRNTPPSPSLSLLALHPASSADRPSVWLALAIFTGLPLALWAYKCLMLVVFQRKVIYMGYIPPGARSEELKDVSVHPEIKCEEIEVSGKCRLSGIVVSRAGAGDTPEALIMYLQGNAGNSLHRLPVFESLLLSFPSHHPAPPNFSIIAVAPRSYWKSTPRRPSQAGILADYRAALAYTTRRFPRTPVILYGHSLGGSAAVCLCAQLTRDECPYVRGLVLENPFASIPAMVKAIYPSPWTPYHHLGRLAWDRWDAVRAAREAEQTSVLRGLSRDVLVLMSAKDEVVPPSMGEEIWEALGQEDEQSTCDALGGLVVVKNALHEDAWRQRQWVGEVRRYVRAVAERFSGNGG